MIGTPMLELLQRARKHIEELEQNYLGERRATVAGNRLLAEIDTAIEAEARSIPVAELDVERLMVAFERADASGAWEGRDPDVRYRKFCEAIAAKYARLASPVVRTEAHDE